MIGVDVREGGGSDRSVQKIPQGTLGLEENNAFFLGPPGQFVCRGPTLV